jgi:hypothetical protein
MKKTGSKQRDNPKLLFVFYNPSANLELARKRLKPLANRIKNVKIVEPITGRMAIVTISKL